MGLAAANVAMTDGERVQRMIFKWLKRATAVEWLGIEPPPVNLGAAPIEIKMIHAFEAIEYNVSNGGWAQFLWNCIDDWRGLIEVAREGYRLIGATEQRAALDHLQGLCAEHERACEELQLQAEQTNDIDNRLFAKFTAGRFHEWERLFWTDSGVYERRLAWLATNKHRVRKALRHPLPKASRSRPPRAL